MELTHSADYLLYEQAECIAAYLGASFMAEKVTGIVPVGTSYCLSLLLEDSLGREKCERIS
jgi:hypothetical protein